MSYVFIRWTPTFHWPGWWKLSPVLRQHTSDMVQILSAIPPMPHQCSIHIEVTKQLLHSPYMIQLKHKTPVAFFYISYFLLANLLKSHIWFTTPKNKTRVHPRHDSKNSDDTPLWIQNDRAHPTHLIWSTFMKNSLQNRDFWKKYFLRRLFTDPG